MSCCLSNNAIEPQEFSVIQLVLLIFIRFIPCKMARSIDSSIQERGNCAVSTLVLTNAKCLINFLFSLNLFEIPKYLMIQLMLAHRERNNCSTYKNTYSIVSTTRAIKNNKTNLCLLVNNLSRVFFQFDDFGFALNYSSSG